jgi:hypothetical protein
MSAALIKHPYMAIAILFLGILLEFSRVLNEGIIQREIPAHQRATIASLNNFIHNLIPFQLIFGIIANSYRLQISYGVFGVSLLSYFLILAIINRQKRVYLFQKVKNIS